MSKKIPDIELVNISRFRGELMGAAMLFIILFHVWLSRGDMFYGLRRCGNVGVDIFLFLSGVGLWFSWIKTPSLKHYFIRRYIRIYPAWLIIACLYYIPRFPKGGNIFDLLGDILINLAQLRIAFLVHTSHHDALYHCAILHETHHQAPVLSMDTVDSRHLVRHGAMGNPHQSSRRTLGNFLE